MTKQEFQVLYSAFLRAKQNREQDGQTPEETRKIAARFREEGCLDAQGRITEAGIERLAPYKVDNAVIMAAGLASRCLPLSRVLPKGLFVVKGEVLIEREIRQLQEAGIREIIVVTGYLVEKFEYLKEKFGVTLVQNPEYKERNNTSSIFAARYYMGNTYVCCADNYFRENIFEPYVYDSYYTCKYSDTFLDEFCLTEIDENGYIKKIQRGGSGYYTMGAVYFSRSFSRRFLELLTREYEDDAVKGMLIDTFHIVHMDELPSTFAGYDDDAIHEFDTLAEFQSFDPEFERFYSKTIQDSLFERYRDIDRYSGVPTDQVTGRLHYNENLWGPSPKCMEVLYQTTPEDLYLYDSAEDDELIVALEKKFGIDRKNLFLHNGSAESIKSLFSIMLNPGDTLLLPSPGWSYYAGVGEYKFCSCVFYDMIEGKDKCAHNIEDILAKGREYTPKIIVVTSPAMPTGNAISAEDLERIVRENPGSMVLVDEAYYGFRPYDVDVRRMIAAYDNVVFSRSFSKYYGLANMRVGYGICSEKAMHSLWLDLPLHKLPHIAKRMAIAALNDTDYYEAIAGETITVREWFYRELEELPGVRPFRSDSNFIYIGLAGYNAVGIREYMKRQGYLIRIFEGNGEEHLRITIAPREIMDDCLSKLKTALENNRMGGAD